MCPVGLRSLPGVGVVLACFVTAFNGWAGGSGLNTVVIANQNSSNSLELANYYCERRGVPPDNVLRISWSGGNISWSGTDFQTNLLAPLLDMLAARRLTNQIDYVVLSMDIPFQTLNGAPANGTTSALFYGLKPDVYGTKGVVNTYAATEQVFAQTKPRYSPGYSFLTTMITADSLAQAKQLVDQGATSDGSFPAQPVALAKSSDPVRNMRYSEFDNAIFNARLRGGYSIVRTISDSPSAQTNLQGYETGLANFSVSPGTFSPGAMADSLSSYGGLIFGPNTQTSLLAFVNGGAAGSYGTVTEPILDLDKFPNSQVYFYQSRGFSLAECYYQGINVPYMGLIVAEPLAAPCQQVASGKWTGISSNAVLSGTTQLSLRFPAWDSKHPLQQIDLFVDGKYFQTVTNLAPRSGNQLQVLLNGFPISYTVPAGATLSSVAAGLTALLNSPANATATRTAAIAHGDRVELHSLSTNSLADPAYFTDTAATNGSERAYRVAYLPQPVPPQLTSLGCDRYGAFGLHIETPTIMPCVVQASTNLVDWLPIFTNLVGGPIDFSDTAASNYSRRFYQVRGSAPDPRPALFPLTGTNGSGFQIHVEAATSLPYALQVSTNLADWTATFTNLAGGPVDFIDPDVAGFASRFYRAILLPQEPAAAVTVVNPAAPDGALLRVDGAARSYSIEVSTNSGQWIPLCTNLMLGTAQTAASSSQGSGDALTTFLSASSSVFLRSVAFGLWPFTLSGSTPVGAWLQLGVTKTNGTSVLVGVTNQSSTATPLDLAGQLSDAIRSTPALQGSDGVALEDLMTNLVGKALFNLRALGPGYRAAGLRAILACSSSLSVTPSYPTALTNNLSDLQDRNHLYVAAGAVLLALTFPFDTTAFADGFHELTAVAYEGSNVRTQTRISLPVSIQNSSLTATFTLLDLADPAPVRGTYHIQVAANAPDVNAIRLFSTGGLLDAATNQSAATFAVSGLSLGAGLHPFYAMVNTASGTEYRTETHWVRLVGGP